MTLTLILTRHAKSSWDDPAQDDHDRPLNKRGRKAALGMGRWIAGQATPGQALVSTARRAVETWEGIAPAFSSAPPVSFLPGLYHAAPGAMLDILNDATARTVLMIGHNPGIGEFAERILAAPPDHPDFARYPTCATLIARFEGSGWAEVGFGQGHAHRFMTARALQG